MAPLPHTSNFASFQELHCSSAAEEQNCIWYMTKDQRRCRKPLNIADRNKAFHLRINILRSLPHGTPLELLEEYARLKCCNHFHRRSIAEHDLVELLARKWQRELSNEDRLHHSEILPSPPTTTEPRAVNGIALHSQTTPRIIQTRLRSRQGTQTEATATQIDAIDSTSSVFRPYKRSNPQPVSSKLIVPIAPTSRPGSIYLYTRASSPGYVKIGYSCNVQSRLKEWRRSCGYEPILLAAFDDVPHMRKVESLIHHQLANVWRTEQRCERCCREHREWFEIDKEEAVKVAGQWAEWMKKAQPYGTRGYLKGIWVDELARLETRGVPVTAEVLLSAHSRLLEVEAEAAREVEETEHAMTNVPDPSRFTNELTAEPDTDIYQAQDLANFLLATLKSMQDLDWSFRRMSQALMTVDTFRRARIDQAHTMVPGSMRSERQGTGATVASKA